MFLSVCNTTYTQQVSGYWQGRLGNHFLGLKVDLKLILTGDSIVGTCYYYTSKNSYVQYSVKGTFNPKTNAVVWYDDKLLKTKNATTLLKVKQNGPMISEVNYNCPGGGKMTLNGKATDAAKKNKNETTINLTKTDKPTFDDDWNVVLDNWTQGGNNPELILSITNKIDKYVPNNNGVE